MKRMLRYLSAIVVVAMLLGALALPAGAAGAATLTGKCGPKATYTLNTASGELTISGTGAMNDYSMGKAPWNNSRAKVLSVTVEPGITRVGNHAFSYHTNLKSVVLADTVTAIGEGAFYANYVLASVEMPKVATVGKNGFFGSFTVDISWPATLTTVGDYAFYNCKGLTDGNLPQGLSSVGQWAFAYCNGLEAVAIPASLKAIGNYAFNGCQGLAELTLPDTLATLGIYAFRGCSALKAVALPDSLTAISAYAFADCKSLEWVWIPGTVRSIGASAFEACAGLEQVNIPASVTSIGSGAFYHCINLSSACYFGTQQQWSRVTIGGNNGPLTGLAIEFDAHDYTAFEVTTERNCTVDGVLTYTAADGATRTQTLPATGHHYVDGDPACTLCGAVFGQEEEIDTGDLLGYGACGPTLTWKLAADGTLTISGTGAMTNYNALSLPPWYEYDLRAAIRSIVVEEGVTYLGEYAFAYSLHATEATLPDSMTEIGSHAFFANYVLSSVKLPANLLVLGDHALFGCYTLPEIAFPDTLVEIGEYALYNCKGLTQLNLPASVRTIGQWAFPYCDGLTEVVLPEGLQVLGDYAFDSCKNLERVVLPESLTTLGMYAFRGCSALTQVNIPGGITAIGRNTFDDCDSLTDILLPPSVTSIAYCAFYNCDALESVVIAAEDCSFGNFVFDKSPNVTLYGVPGSAVQAYADRSGIAFADIAAYRAPEPEQPEEPTEPEPEEPEEPEQPTEPEPKEPEEPEQPEQPKAPELAITGQPASATVSKKANVAFTISATGEGLSYQWQVCQKKDDWSAISGARASTYQFEANKNMSGYKYRCIVTDSSGAKMTSAAATLTVK